MKRLGRAAALAGAALLWAGTSQAQEGDGPRMLLAPAEVELAGGETTLELRILHAPPSSGFSVDLVFDGDRIALTGVELGPWPGSTGRAVQPLGPTVATGRLAVGALMVGQLPAPDGDGVLARITFAPLGSGRAGIDVGNPTLVGADGSPIEVAGEGAVITIDEAPSEQNAMLAATSATALAAAPRTGLSENFVAAVEEQATIAAPARSVRAATALATFTPIRGAGGDASGSRTSGGPALVLIAVVVAGALFVWAVVRRGG